MSPTRSPVIGASSISLAFFMHKARLFLRLPKGVNVIGDVDVAQENARETIVNGLNGNKVDLVIVNADEHEMYKIVAMAPVFLVHHLRKSKSFSPNTKVAIITTKGGSIALCIREEGGGNFGHHASKAVANMVGRLLAYDLAEEDVMIHICTPGFMRTDMTKGVGFDKFYDSGGVAVLPVEAAASALDFIESFSIANIGSFWALCGPRYCLLPRIIRILLQLLDKSNISLTGFSFDSSSAPVGVNPECGIPRVNHTNSFTTSKSLGNIANIVLCGVSIFFVLALIIWTSRRKAAVGRSELRIFLVFYLLTLPFQLLTTGALLEQGSTALVALTAIHAGLVATLFWTLLANALVATQVVEDGTPSSIVSASDQPIFALSLLFFVATTYISFDVALSITSTFGPSNPPAELRSVPLFVLTSIWPGAAALLYFLIMAYIVLGVLRERRPMLYYLAAAICFVLSQLAWFLLSKVLCRNTSAAIDGSFIATTLETAAVGVLFLGWRSITEESWDDYNY
ncbi:hypothetical protein EW145_g6050 [Phellinidium pouzarii]|uniref:Uncharacterized protein n=1 Tax=Phellinidium pouzarii TaxID=167371 RepID=A0A4V3XBY5_9AGAM|nr:hypothetical protein EW145_g6050 [Phellinidium pouzarii]